MQNNSGVVGTYPTNALNARVAWSRVSPERSDARLQPALVCTTLTKRPRATARLARDRAAGSKPAAAPWRGRIDRSQTVATPPGKNFSLSTRLCLSCAGPRARPATAESDQIADISICPPCAINNRRNPARCDRRAVIAASIRIYALVARGHRLRRDGRRRKRRAGHLGRRYRREIRGLVVADPYAGIGGEPVGGGERVARAQRAVHREID